MEDKCLDYRQDTSQATGCAQQAKGVAVAALC
jgi:hypothetical protein